MEISETAELAEALASPNSPREGLPVSQRLQTAEPLAPYPRRSKEIISPVKLPSSLKGPTPTAPKTVRFRDYPDEYPARSSKIAQTLPNVQLSIPGSPSIEDNLIQIADEFLKNPFAANLRLPQ